MWTTNLLQGLGLYQPLPTQNPYSQQTLNMLGQAAPQLNTAQSDQMRQQQLQQINQLQGVASGQQQGAGELAAQRQVQNALAAQQAQARMARGGANAALAYRGAANNAAGIGLSGAGQAQQAALQDQQTAQGQLSGALNNARGQDIGIAGQNAGLQAGQNQLGMSGYLGLGQQNLQAQQQAAQSANAASSGLLGGIGSGLATIFSDARDKTNVSDAGGQIDKMLDGIKAKSYAYKDQAMGQGQRVGVMAQDVAKSPAGAAAVRPVAGHQTLDVNKALSLALAATGRLHQRVKALESKRG